MTMPWRWGWPPWEPERVRQDRHRALEEVERSTVDLTETRQQMERTTRLAASIVQVGRRNHFSEAMEQLFENARSARQARQ